MPNPRTVALIGLASAAAAIAPTRYGPQPELARPTVYAITVAAETVWFCSRYSERALPINYAFVRGSREWVQSRLAAPCTNRPSLGDDEDTIPIGGHLVAFRVPIDPLKEG